MFFFNRSFMDEAYRSGTMTPSASPQRPRTRRVILPPVLDFAGTADLQRQLQAALASGESLTLDAGSVSEVTAQCLQLLAAASIAFAQSKGPHLGIAPLSAAFR